MWCSLLDLPKVDDCGPAGIGPRSCPRSGSFEFALGGDALFLGDFRKALTLAGIQALAGVVATFAGTLAFTGVRADTLSISGICCWDIYGRTCKKDKPAAAAIVAPDFEASFIIVLQKSCR